MTPLAGKLYCLPSAPLAWLLCVGLSRHGLAVLIDCATLVELSLPADALCEVADEGDERDRAIGRVVAHLFSARDFAKASRARRSANGTVAA